MHNDDIELSEANAAKEAIDRALEILGEHFDSVQILASHVTVNKETVSAFFGVGDWYARTGMAAEFLSRNNAQNIAWEIKSED